jgi:hypothetical protein
VIRVGEHPVPAGPLAVRWLAYAAPETRAGEITTVRVALENAGGASWRSRNDVGIQLSYHWLDTHGNPIVWDGVRTPLVQPVRPGESVEVDVTLRAPRPPGRYRLAIDLLEEHHFWFAELGSAPLDLTLEVQPRIADRRLAVTVHGGADEATTEGLRAQDEPVVEADAVAVAHLVAGAVPPSDWARRILDAHAEGFAAVGPAIAPTDRGTRRRLTAWAPGGGRNPRFPAPLLLPSLLVGLSPGSHEGLPSYSGEDALFEGRVAVTLRPRSDRRRG